MDEQKLDETIRVAQRQMATAALGACLIVAIAVIVAWLFAK